MKILYLIYLILLTGVCGCKDRGIHQQQVENSKTETIKVIASDRNVMVPFEQYFSSWRIVPLETIPASVIGTVSRISSYNKKFYILDKQTNSLLIFNNDGKFLNKIQRIGNGKGEYVGLQDFTIDEKNKQIIMYAHRPYKLIYFDLSGNFKKEERVDGLYDDISFSDDGVLLLNSRGEVGYTLITKDANSGKKKYYLPLTNKAKIFAEFKSSAPYLLKGSTTHLFLPYTDTIYEYKNKQLFSKYYIDFVENKIPDETFNRNLNYDQLNEIVKDKNYAFKILNFKENKNYAYFTYGSNTIVIYSKKKKKCSLFTFVTNEKLPILFGNIFGHDGVDRDLLTICPANKFKGGIDKLKANEEKWKKIPDNVKQIASGLDVTSNPLLIFYTLKDDL